VVRRVVACSDKFRGTASAAEICQAVASSATAAGWAVDRIPMADGGEGTLDALGGPNRTTAVSGPLGDPVEAGWRLTGRRAVIEMAAASGLDLVGGAAGNDAVAASTYGTGELIAAAIDGGARDIIVGVGGSATTDGGLGALRAMNLARLTGVSILVAHDVTTRFVDAARQFAPQKGASPAEVKLLVRRLERLAQVYLEEHGVDVRELPGSGAAGGLAGGLVTAGARLEPGFEVVGDVLGLFEAIDGADLVVTGEGFVDAGSFDGKVVGGVVEACRSAGVPVLVVAGEVFDGIDESLDVVDLSARFGRERAMSDVLGCVEAVVAERLAMHVDQPSS